MLTVCTGNICRSPIAEQALRARMAQFAPAQSGRLTFASAGTLAETGQAMPEQAAEWSRRLGGDPRGHAATFLTEAVLRDATLVLAMSREHRNKVVSLAPSLLRRTFTIRELARLFDAVTESDLRAAIDGPFVEQTPEGRLAAVLGAVADSRALNERAAAAAVGDADDVIDPYRRSDDTYALAAEQLRPGVDAVQRILTYDFIWQDG